jgi:hypothetical protein
VGGAYHAPIGNIAIFPGHTESSKPPKLTATLLSRGQKGWREYRQTGGVQRYARDRWWVKDAGKKWRKKARHRKDLPSMTEDEYGQWKAKRAIARAKKRKRAARSVSSVRQVALGKPGRS